MLSENFIWLSLAIAAYGNYFYIRDTLRGDTQPNRVTFFLWGFAPLISFFASRDAGGGDQIFYTLLIALMPFTILAASFINKQAYWRITPFDIGCGLISLLALVFLLVSHQPLWSLAFSIVADLFAGIPTIIKSYKYPDSETVLAYGFEIIGSAVVILTIHDWHPSSYLFAIYILCMNTLFTSLLVFSPHKGRKQLPPAEL